MRRGAAIRERSAGHAGRFGPLAVLIAFAAVSVALTTGCGSGAEESTSSDVARAAHPPEIAFIRASGTRLSGETVHRTGAHVFVWRRGAAPERLTSGAGEDAGPAWSPDGETIFFSRAPGPGDGRASAEIYRVEASGGRATRVTRCRPPACTGDTLPRVSPDGGTLAFLRTGPGGSEVATLGLRDRRLTLIPLPDGLKPFTSLSWRSADEVTLSAYGRGTEVHAYEATPSLRPLRPLPVCEQPSKCAVPGPISWSSDPAGPGAVEASPENGSAIYVLSDRLASAPAVGCAGDRCPHNPAISPDGRLLAFDRGDDFGGDLFISDRDGRSLERITAGGDLDCCASWRP